MKTLTNPYLRHVLLLCGMLLFGVSAGALSNVPCYKIDSTNSMIYINGVSYQFSQFDT